MARKPELMGNKELVRGSLIRLRRRCGKPTCRCAQGAPHETPALSYSVNGTTRLLTLRPEEVGAVRAALGRYRQGQRELERQALAGLTALRQRLVAAKVRRRQGR